MISRENVTREALSELEARRAENMRIEKARREEAAQKSDVIAALLERRQKLFFSGVRDAFARPQSAQDISGRMGEELLQINEELKKALAASGLPQDYLQPVYRCALCRDTGYVGEPIHEQCACLKRAVMNRIYQDDGLQILARENFAAFDESVFPEEPVKGHKGTQRSYTVRVRKFCEQYADSFAPGEGRGLLLTGASGLGKTFLMNCVAQRVLERGYSVVLISAYKLLDVMRQYQFRGENEARVADILSCDLLCVDDLGSEPMLRDVTVSTLYHIVNERRNEGRSILITTNLDSDGIYERYDDRVGARLTDPSRMKVLPFAGKDVRRFIGAKG